MHDPQKHVREFHLKVVRQPSSPARPALRDARLRARLVVEEAVEAAVGLVGREAALALLAEHAERTMEKPFEPDIVEAIDGLVDTIWVCYGTAEAIGVDLEPFWDAVRRANMAKLDFRTGEGDGKKGVKPPGWVSPQVEIRRLLDAAAAEADDVDDARKRVDEAGYVADTCADRLKPSCEEYVAGTNAEVKP